MCLSRDEKGLVPDNSFEAEVVDAEVEPYVDTLRGVTDNSFEEEVIDAEVKELSAGALRAFYEAESKALAMAG